MANNLLLLITAAIWGFAFVAQRKGMESVDPLTFNALRFLLGALFVRFTLYKSFRKKAKLILLPGVLLFIATGFQQTGIVFTSAGNAGFITGLYVVFVPLIGIFRGQKLKRSTIVSILLAVGGLYLINSFESLDISLGNLLVLISAVFFALHVQVVDKLTKLHPTAVLAFNQFAVCAVLSALSAVVWRLIGTPAAFSLPNYFMGIKAAFWPIFYGGIFSAGIAYTLQIKAQKKADPAPAAVIMSLEGVFAMLGGYLLLSESVTLRTLAGALLLLLAMLMVSLPKNLIDRKSPADLSA